MKNKNKWLLTSNTHKGIKHIKPCPNLMGKDQFVLFMNGHQQKGIQDYDSLVTLVASLGNCTQCPNDCTMCLTFNEFTPNVSFTLNLNSENIVLYSAEIYYNGFVDVDQLTNGVIAITETLTIPLNLVNYIFGNEQKDVFIYSYNFEGKCITKKLILHTKSLGANLTEFDLSTIMIDMAPSCNNGTFSILPISIPEGSSISVNTDTWIVTLIDTVTAVENKFILGIYCDGCLVGLYTVSTREPDPEPILGLRLTFLPGFLPPIDLASWNTVFDLPANGTAFTSITSAGDEVTLIGGAGITLRAGLFRTNDKLLKIEDDVDCVVAIGGGRNLGALSLCSALTTVVLNGVITVAEEGLFDNPLLTSLSLTDCTTIGVNGLALNDAIVTLTLPSVTSVGNTGMREMSLLTSFTSSTLLTVGNAGLSANTSLTTFSAPSLTTIGTSGMQSCTSATLINIPLCINLGTNPADATVFNLIVGQTITLNIAAVNATNNAGGVHASIAYLIANNSATVNYI